MTTTAIIAHQTISAIVDNVTHARADVQQAFVLLQGAKERLTAVLGKESYYTHLWERDLSDYNLPRDAERSDTYIARNAWRYVLKQTGLQSFMTEKRQKELQDQLAKGHFPPLTVENVLSTLQGLTSQVSTLLQESAKEVFDWLRPSLHSHVGGLKTNKQFRIGDKAIVGWAVESNYSRGYRLNYHRQANFRALGNVFSLLDGQGAQQYPDDLVTQLNAALATAHAGGIIAVSYLACKPYKNGNMHLRFLRRDLVDKLNQIGGDGTLPDAE